MPTRRQAANGENSHSGNRAPLIPESGARTRTRTKAIEVNFDLGRSGESHFLHHAHLRFPDPVAAVEPGAVLDRGSTVPPSEHSPRSRSDIVR